MATIRGNKKSDILTALEEVAVEEIKEEIMAVETKPVRLMYVGPNIPGGRLMSGQVFKGGYPPHCGDLFELIPEVKELFVSIDRVMEVQKKLKEPGSNEARLFSIVKNAKGVK